jgi:Na+/H+ antiporter NhaD/arsenite permease-like protein
MHPAFTCAVSDETMRASMFSLIMGSNFGANLALNGALAGLMWQQILVDRRFPFGALCASAA